MTCVASLLASFGVVIDYSRSCAYFYSWSRSAMWHCRCLLGKVHCAGCIWVLNLGKCESEWVPGGWMCYHEAHTRDSGRPSLRSTVACSPSFIHSKFHSSIHFFLPSLLPCFLGSLCSFIHSINHSIIHSEIVIFLFCSHLFVAQFICLFICSIICLFVHIRTDEGMTQENMQFKQPHCLLQCVMCCCLCTATVSVCVCHVLICMIWCMQDRW